MFAGKFGILEINGFSGNPLQETVTKDYVAANPIKKYSSRQMEECIKWKPPDHDFSKLNFDGSVINNQSDVIGFVIRDEEGCPVIEAHHVPITEALALREGLCSASRLNLTKVQMEGDSKLIIDCVLNKCSKPWRLKSIIKDIQILASQFQDIHFVHIF